ncbi:MAG TPA: hypothetical protein VEK80_05280 [Kribbellaceae bacterium]|nr:hypothetical protein [Kribbellaceae bacterium]
MRPLLLGYVRAHLLMTETELGDVKQDLADFAVREGYTLGQVYVERIDRAPAAFQTLVDDVRRNEVKAVVVPGLHHLGVLGSPAALKEHLEHYTGVRVLTAYTAP